MDSKRCIASCENFTHYQEYIDLLTNFDILVTCVIYVARTLLGESRCWLLCNSLFVTFLWWKSRLIGPLQDPVTWYGILVDSLTCPGPHQTKCRPLSIKVTECNYMYLNNDDIIFNYSHRVLTGAEKKVLARGSRFCLPPKESDTYDVKCSSELIRVCWEASYAVGLSKQRKVELDWYEFLCLKVPLCNLRSFQSDRSRRWWEYRNSSTVRG